MDRIDGDHDGRPWLIVVSGWTGAGKSTLADALARDLGATVASFDWLMSGLREHAEVWNLVESPPERQRSVGWSLLSRVAEHQLRRDASVVLDLVAREAPRQVWEQLAQRHDSRFAVIECVCSDLDVHRSRVVGRDRAIPGWYELDWDNVRNGRERYEPLAEPKLVLDAVDDLDANIDRAHAWLAERGRAWKS